MKGYEAKFRWESFFNFLKMDKKNVQFQKAGGLY